MKNVNTYFNEKTGVLSLLTNLFMHMKLSRVLWSLLLMNDHSESTMPIVQSPKWFLSHLGPEIIKEDTIRHGKLGICNLN